MVGLVVFVASTGTPFTLGVAAGSPSSETLGKLLTGLIFPVSGDGGDLLHGVQSCAQQECTVSGPQDLEVHDCCVVPSDGQRPQVKRVVGREAPGCAQGSTGVT